MNRVIQKFKDYFRSQDGSLSILIMGLVLSSVLVLIILTDISSVYLAKRALTQATEAAAQRGVRNLNTELYYTSHYVPDQYDPGIPIDCEKGRRDSFLAIQDWIQLSQNQSSTIGRPNLKSIQINEFVCDGYEISIAASARVRLPFLISIFNVTEIDIYSKVSSIAERKKSGKW